MPINQTREILENIFNGTSPVKRSNPEPGESAYYYLQPDANASTVNQMQRIDIQNSNIQSQHLGKFDDDIIKKNKPIFYKFQ